MVRRLELSCQFLSAAGAHAERVQARGETPLEWILSLAMLGDLVSVYLAALQGVDPTPVGGDRAVQGGAGVSFG